MERRYASSEYQSSVGSHISSDEKLLLQDEMGSVKHTLKDMR